MDTDTVRSFTDEQMLNEGVASLVMDEYIRKIVAQAPPLSEEQARKIAVLFDVERRAAEARAERRPHTGAAPEGLSCRSRLPGKPEQSNEEVLQEYRKTWDEGLAQTPMFSMWYPCPRTSSAGASSSTAAASKSG